MFDEKSSVWIKIYKGITIFLFFAIALMGIIFAFGDATGGIMDIGLGGDDDGFLDFMCWILVAGSVDFMFLSANMLVINLLANIQSIKEKIEEK